MTVITFAKRGFVSTAFGGRSFATAHPAAVRHRENNFSFATLAAAAGIAAIAVMAALGIRSGIIAMAVSRHTAQISRLEAEIEQLRIEAMALSGPQAITAQARMLQLVESAHPNRYITLTPPGEVALK